MLRIRAAGYETFESRVETRPRDGVPVRVQMIPSRATDSAGDTPRGPGAGPWVLVGVGGAIVVAGVATGIAVDPVYQSSLVNCDSTGCPDENYPIYQRAVALNTAFPVLLSVGGASVAAGVLWYVLAPRGARRASAWQWQITPNTVGVATRF